tara:strand:+ start:1192 stop:1458 length:267 start_codon:yes stop_codon:yes gene_type:complete
MTWEVFDMQEQEDKKFVEFKIIRDEEMPPIIFKPGAEDEVNIIINQNFAIWLALHRKTIGGCAEALFDKIDEMLSAHLSEQRMYEKME